MLYYAMSASAPCLLYCAEKAMEQLTLQPIKRIEGHVQLPGSKSLSNRVLLLAALSEGTTLVKNLLVGSAYLGNFSLAAQGHLHYRNALEPRAQNLASPAGQ